MMSYCEGSNVPSARRRTQAHAGARKRTQAHVGYVTIEYLSRGAVASPCAMHCRALARHCFVCRNGSSCRAGGDLDSELKKKTRYFPPKIRESRYHGVLLSTVNLGSCLNYSRTRSAADTRGSASRNGYLSRSAGCRDALTLRASSGAQAVGAAGRSWHRTADDADRPADRPRHRAPLAAAAHARARSARPRIDPGFARLFVCCRW